MTTHCGKFSNQYTMAIKTVGTRQKITYAPKSMLRFMYYFMSHGGVVFG